MSADDGKLLAEIRDLLAEQNRLIGLIHARNEEVATRSAAAMDRSEAAAKESLDALRSSKRSLLVWAILFVVVFGLVLWAR